MAERLDRRPSRIGRAIKLGVAGVLLAVPLTAGRTNAAETTEPSQPLYINLPDWDCNQKNLLGKEDRTIIDYTRPQTSITNELISVTYPAIEDDTKLPQTVIYENPGLESGQILRYYSDSRDCPLPDGAPTIPVS